MSTEIAILAEQISDGSASAREAIAYLEHVVLLQSTASRALEIIKEELVGKTLPPNITAWDDPALQVFNTNCLVGVFPDATVWPLWHPDAADHLIVAMRELAMKHRNKIRLTTHPECHYHIRNFRSGDVLEQVWGTIASDAKLQARAMKLVPKDLAKHGFVVVA